MSAKKRPAPKSRPIANASLDLRGQGDVTGDKVNKVAYAAETERSTAHRLNTTMNTINILDSVCNLISLRHCMGEMGVKPPVATAWLKARLFQPIDILGEPMITREQLTEFERFARMGYFDKNRYARKDRNGFVQSEFLFQEGGFAE